MTSCEFPPFVPVPFLRNPHVQTIVGAYLATPRLDYRAAQHVVALPDGDAVVLHDDVPNGWKPADRVAMLVHGLGGGYKSPYMPRVAEKLNRRGVRTFRMDLRGFGAGLMIAQGPGHAGRSDDAIAAVRFIGDLCPQAPVTAIGFSMGGNIVLKMIGEAGDQVVGKLDSAIAVAPPIDLPRCSAHMNLGINRIYSRTFVRSLVKHVKRRRPYAPELAKIPLRPWPRLLYEFDDRFTAPLGGFASAADYYERASAGPLLPRIKIPTLIISASDDPLIPADILRDAPLSAATSLYLTQHGGHVGFLGVAGIDPDRNWLDWRIVDWVLSQDRLQRTRRQPPQGAAAIRCHPRTTVRSPRRMKF